MFAVNVAIKVEQCDQLFCARPQQDLASGAFPALSAAETND
jgi:hypothetical protein